MKKFLTLYEKRLDDSCERDYEAEHIRYMLTQIPDWMELDPEKAHRWIGFVQGWFWAKSLFTIDTMKEHVRDLKDDLLREKEEARQSNPRLST